MDGSFITVFIQWVVLTNDQQGFAKLLIGFLQCLYNITLKLHSKSKDQLVFKDVSLKWIHVMYIFANGLLFFKGQCYYLVQLCMSSITKNMHMQKAKVLISCLSPQVDQHLCFSPLDN